MNDKKIIITEDHIRYIEYTVKSMIDISKDKVLANKLGKSIIDTLKTGIEYER